MSCSKRYWIVSSCKAGCGATLSWHFLGCPLSFQGPDCTRALLEEHWRELWNAGDMTGHLVNFKGFPFSQTMLQEAVKGALLLGYTITVKLVPNLSNSDIFIKIHLLKITTHSSKNILTFNKRNESAPLERFKIYIFKTS